MTATTADLAAHLDVDESTISVLADQISDDPDLYDLDSGGLTLAGVEVVTAQVRSESGRRDLDADLADVVERIRDIDAQASDALDERDALIRRMLADGVTYARLGGLTGLSRSGLDTIRRGSRTRRR